MEITAAVRNNAAADQELPMELGRIPSAKRFCLGSPILKHPTFFKETSKNPRHLCFGAYFWGGLIFWVGFRKIHHNPFETSHDSTYKSESPEAFSTPEDFTNFSSLLGGTFCLEFLRTDLGTSPRDFFFFGKGPENEDSNLERTGPENPWLDGVRWDGDIWGSDPTNPTMVGLDPFGAGDDGFRMIQKLKQPVENALTTVFSQVVVESMYL